MAINAETIGHTTLSNWLKPGRILWEKQLTLLERYPAANPINPRSEVFLALVRADVFNIEPIILEQNISATS